MSWSVSCVGKPQNVIAHLHEYGAGLSGMSKTEFDDALPHLEGVIAQNYHRQDGTEPPLLEFIASGSGYKTETTDSRSCNVSIKTDYRKFV